MANNCAEIRTGEGLMNLKAAPYAIRVREEPYTSHHDQPHVIPPERGLVDFRESHPPPLIGVDDVCITALEVLIRRVSNPLDGKHLRNVKRGLILGVVGKDPLV
jgi:hypothetical protein